VLRWLSRLFRQRAEADAAAAAPPPPQAAPIAVSTSTARDVVTTEGAVREPALAPSPNGDAEAKETCPTCGRTSVFAGPPGQRFCTYCALRDELFEARAAASE
jgi:hypothetical protein